MFVQVSIGNVLENILCTNSAITLLKVGVLRGMVINVSKKTTEQLRMILK